MIRRVTKHFRESRVEGVCEVPRPLRARTRSRTKVHSREVTTTEVSGVMVWEGPTPRALDTRKVEGGLYVVSSKWFEQTRPVYGDG